MRKAISMLFAILALAAALSRATGHHERTNQYTTYAHRMATATAQAKVHAPPPMKAPTHQATVVR